MLAIARQLAPGGRLICIDGDRAAARRAAARAAAAGAGDRVSIMIGDPALFVRKVAGPFDLIVIAIDGDARRTVERHVPRLLAPGGRAIDGWDKMP